MKTLDVNRKHMTEPSKSCIYIDKDTVSITFNITVRLYILSNMACSLTLHSGHLVDLMVLTQVEKKTLLKSLPRLTISKKNIEISPKNRIP